MPTNASFALATPECVTIFERAGAGLATKPAVFKLVCNIQAEDAKILSAARYDCMPTFAFAAIRRIRIVEVVVFGNDRLVEIVHQASFIWRITAL
ncbi:hypothetical protein AC628_01160, partial [Bradyrhizobium sp. NAS96.2]